VRKNKPGFGRVFLRLPFAKYRDRLALEVVLEGEKVRAVL
jgi:hypothetical protein